MPPVCEAAELDLDVLLISHEHNDHFDVDAIGELIKDKTEVYTNSVVAAELQKLGYDMDRIHVLKKGSRTELPGYSILAVDCDHGFWLFKALLCGRYGSYPAAAFRTP